MKIILCFALAVVLLQVIKVNGQRPPPPPPPPQGQRPQQGPPQGQRPPPPPKPQGAPQGDCPRHARPAQPSTAVPATSSVVPVTVDQTVTPAPVEVTTVASVSV